MSQASTFRLYRCICYKRRPPLTNLAKCVLLVIETNTLFKKSIAFRANDVAKVAYGRRIRV